MAPRSWSGDDVSSLQAEFFSVQRRTTERSKRRFIVVRLASMSQHFLLHRAEYSPTQRPAKRDVVAATTRGTVGKRLYVQVSLSQMAGVVAGRQPAAASASRRVRSAGLLHHLQQAPIAGQQQQRCLHRVLHRGRRLQEHGCLRVVGGRRGRHREELVE